MRSSATVILVCALVAGIGCKKKTEPAATAKTEPAAAQAEPAGVPATPEPAAAPVTEPKAPEPAAKPAPEMKAMKLTAAEGWEGEFNETLASWTYEKYTPAADGTNAPNRFYVDVFPEDAPKDLEAYAGKLTSDSNFQDMGFIFTAVASKETLDNGWLILGTQKDVNDAEDQGHPAFVMFRSDVNVRCHGGTFQSEALRDEAVAACKSISF